MADRRVTLFVVAWLCALPAISLADVDVVVGPTAIPRGDAIGKRDITVSNGIFAIAFAVDTAPPWGVARGGIVDIALIEDGEPGYDIASLADFMPNNWSSWPTTYQRVEIDRISNDEVRIETERDWGSVALETSFRVRDGDSRIHMVTRMTNNGEELLEGLLSGYVVWPDGGYLIGEPVVSGNGDNELPGGWTAAYDENWLLGLHAPFSETAMRRGRDRYTQHDLAAGESKTIEAWLQLEGEGALALMVQTEIEFRQLPAGRISGSVVSDDGETVARPAVVISRDSEPYAWATGVNGDYEMTLPVGDYEVYATARGYARGDTRQVSVAAGSDAQLDFDDVRPPGSIHVEVIDTVTGQALDAKVSIREGYQPRIGYFGKDIFFSELNPVGVVREAIAPGRYLLEVSAGGGFLSLPREIEVAVDAGQETRVEVGIPVTATPRKRGWYSADLHHHSDVLDGFTEPQYVLRSELAAGVDVAFLSDHDSVVNNHEMQLLADARGIPFIPGTELSPSWAHFNAYPIDDGETVDIDTGRATVQDIFASARDMGADVIEVNHPYSEYGYFESLEKEAVPGGYDPGFDLVEIQPVSDNKGALAKNRETLEKVWQLWNDGHKAYLAAGSDVHDVWNLESGRARTFVHVEGEFSIEKFMAALKAGHAYASQGPLVYPEILFGSEIRHRAGYTLVLRYAVEAVSGLRSVRVIERGKEIDMFEFEDVTGLASFEFAVTPDADTWYSLVIGDASGSEAYTNPVWVTTGE